MEVGILRNSIPLLYSPAICFLPRYPATLLHFSRLHSFILKGCRELCPPFPQELDLSFNKIANAPWDCPGYRSGV